MRQVLLRFDVASLDTDPTSIVTETALAASDESELTMADDLDACPTVGISPSVRIVAEELCRRIAIKLREHEPHLQIAVLRAASCEYVIAS